MDRWPQRARFKELVSAYRARHGLSRNELASALGVAESTLHNYLYNRQLVPSVASIQRAAKLFRVSISELMDDPGVGIPGLSGKKLTQSDELDRAIIQEVFRDLTNLKPAQKRHALTLWRASIKVLKDPKRNPAN